MLAVTRLRTTSGRSLPSASSTCRRSPALATVAIRRTVSSGRCQLARSTSGQSIRAAPGSRKPRSVAATASPLNVSAHASRRSPASSGTAATTAGNFRRPNRTIQSSLR